MKVRKILVMGLPGAGKTTLARELAPLFNALCMNADEIRNNVHRDLGFKLEDRIEHARRVGWWAENAVKCGCNVVADFVCPTPETRAQFKPDIIVWMNTIKISRFADTNKLFVPPTAIEARDKLIIINNFETGGVVYTRINSDS